MQFATWSFETELPLSLGAVQKAAKTLPIGIYRAKGVLRLEDGRRAVLHVVGKRVDLSVGDIGTAPEHCRIVAIGKRGAWTEDALHRHFMADTPTLTA